MSAVKSLQVTYDSINAKNAFTNGDFVSGRVTLEVAKDCQMETLSIKFKGKAEVRWSERHGQTTVVYHSKDKYFSIKHYFVRSKEHEGRGSDILLTQENGETYSSVVAPGCHVYPFTFQFPVRSIPSSFKGAYGKIVYMLDAKLGRSLRVDQKDSTKINFVAKPDLRGDFEIMKPKHMSMEKKMKVFTSGSVAMDVNLEKAAFYQGEGLKVMTSIQNNSSREIKAKYTVYSKHSFFAKGKRRLNTKDLLKEVGDSIAPSSKENFTRVIPIPHDAEPSIANCRIMKVEYRLRVYLDVKYASDPEIKFPIVILPSSQVPAVAPSAFGSDFGAFGSTNTQAWDFPPPQQPPAASNPLDPPPPYGEHSAYPLTDFGTKF
ncbi:arrestin domain-containing protein 3-like [Brachionichthys hirsutus]|uniref:arrestin domain-containing protein 3-like n=1 Tax=Brachionichthys hirsutus TaxID=412623 RepID=UPI003604D8CF